MAITRKYRGWIIFSKNWTNTLGEDRLSVAAIPEGIYPEHSLTTQKINNYWYNNGGSKEWDMFSEYDFYERSEEARIWLNRMKERIDRYKIK